MSKFRTKIIVFTIGCLIYSISVWAQQAGTETAPSPRRERRPEQLSAPKIVPGTTAEMQTPEFWISNINGDPDRVILDAGQIEELNREYNKRGTEFTDVFGNPYSIKRIIDGQDFIGNNYHVEDPLSFTTFHGDSIKTRIERHNGAFMERNQYSVRNKKFDDEMKQKLVDITNLDSVPDRINVTHGIIVKHTSGKRMPSLERISGRPGSPFSNIQSGMIDFGQPVAIMHASKNRECYYVLSQTIFAWVPAIHVAVGSANDIGKYIDSDDFIVATCHKVPIYGDKVFQNYIVDFYMGAKVRLIKKTQGGYEVSFPYRKPDGSFGQANGWVRPDACVSVGYQPFTQSNVINTIFSLLYRPYSWKDADNERDCCGTVRTVLRTCGINTGRWTTHQLHASDNVKMFPRKTPKEEKYRLLDGTEPGISLVGDGGHISLYLGEVGGRHYVIHQSGYSYNDEDGKRLNVNRVNVNDTELAGGSNIGSWTEITTIKP